jgi:hypothetical protein
MKLPGKPKTIKLQEGIHDRDILSRPLSNPDIKYHERSPEEFGKEMDGRSENMLLMKYHTQIDDPNITDDELRYILSGKGVPAFGGRPNAIDKIIKNRKTIKMQEGIHDRDILSRPLSNPAIEPLERSPEEIGKEMDASSENILRMRYSRQISDPNVTDDELRYILGGKGVKGFGGRPNAIEKIIKNRNIRESYMDTLGGETPYGKYEMIKNIVEPNLGSNYKAYIMFDPKGEYESMKKKYASNTDGWKNLYRSSNYQGYADMSPDGNVIKATVLDKGGVVGAIYIKDSVQESQIRSVIQQIIKEELNMKEIDNAGKMAEYEAKTKKISEEILKRKKKLKALTTLEEIEKGSTNKDMMKSLKKEIKTLENLKTKLDKKFTPKEEVIGEETPVPLKEGYGGMSLKDAKEEAKRISKEEGVIQHVERTEEGSNKYRVSDWYDSDLTVASYNKGYEQ